LLASYLDTESADSQILQDLRQDLRQKRSDQRSAALTQAVDAAQRDLFMLLAMKHYPDFLQRGGKETSRADSNTNTRSIDKNSERTESP
jgi:hypothetical protein